MRKISISLFSLSVGFILSFPSILYAYCTGNDVTSMVTVTFVCANGRTVQNQNVYVAGNVPQLGCNPNTGHWDTNKAVKLSNQNGLIYPTWTQNIQVPQGVCIQWKCLKMGVGDPQWQQDPNNQFYSGGDGHTNDCPRSANSGGWPPQ
jgi:hypothetical protein